MTAIGMIKMPGGMLRAANEVDSEALNKIENGRYVTAEIVKVRNPQFHAKFMKLLTFCFEYWNPPQQELNGILSEKSFNKYRYDVMCMAGFCKVVVGFSGKATLEAESISFANMDDVRFEEVYRAVFNVLWKTVMSNIQGFTEEKVEETVNRLLSFD